MPRITEQRIRPSRQLAGWQRQSGGLIPASGSVRQWKTPRLAAKLLRPPAKTGRQGKIKPVLTKARAHTGRHTFTPPPEWEEYGGAAPLSPGPSHWLKSPAR